MTKASVFAILAVYLFYLTHLGSAWAIALIATLWLAAADGYQFCRLAVLTLPRDLHLLQRGLKLLFRMIYVKRKNLTVVQAFRQTVAKYPHRVMFVNAGTGEEWTYAKASHHTYVLRRSAALSVIISRCYF